MPWFLLYFRLIEGIRFLAPDCWGATGKKSDHQDCKPDQGL